MLQNKYINVEGNANVSQHQFFVCYPMHILKIWYSHFFGTDPSIESSSENEVFCINP